MRLKWYWIKKTKKQQQPNVAHNPNHINFPRVYRVIAEVQRGPRRVNEPVLLVGSDFMKLFMESIFQIKQFKIQKPKNSEIDKCNALQMQLSVYLFVGI